MKELLDAFWRAAAYCLHPKVIGLSALPLLVCAAIALGLGWFYWEAALQAVRATLESWRLVDTALHWVETLVGSSFRTVLAPLIVVVLALPAVVVLSLLLVALLMTPAIVGLIGARRFPALERRQGASVLVGFSWSLVSSVLALAALLVTLPLWLIPPLILILPPLIWGWLAYRVMSFDVLAEHADPTERRLLMRRHRGPLLAIGLVTGYLGAAPSLLWAFSVGTLIFAPLLVVISIWLYTLVFAFSTLWFAHYCLAALARLRAEAQAAVEPPAPQMSAIEGSSVAPN
ncbi:EI24 domain-containing protein [Aquincola sp. S2]|uniref:EI24 domain-containing protein n=1 Tax=Pseudaquabacterium terrae TaxID=2732868 RepID=A0ABX2EI72_9BURK|nr:EI24 domain-containing protein [Aquabacterium terrae]NRF68309.1 EI24 domain-containing protein [Aquabacterium terrae]